MAVRLSYSLISAAPAWGQPRVHKLRIHILYASGRSQSRPERFDCATEAVQFIDRFYPDLVGKCTGIEVLPPPQPANPASQARSIPVGANVVFK
jgi:hypothetical protein